MASNARGTQVIWISTALNIVATIAVLLRLLARWRSKAPYAADDFLIILSLVPQYVMLGIGALSKHSLFFHYIRKQSAHLSQLLMTLLEWGSQSRPYLHLKYAAFWRYQ